MKCQVDNRLRYVDWIVVSKSESPAKSKILEANTVARRAPGRLREEGFEGSKEAELAGD